MNPQFPQFKNIELSDKNFFETYTHKFPPYSEYNFANMWSWNTKEQVGYSIHKNNLVLKLTDYITGDLYYSFLGDSHPKETVKAILDLIVEEGKQRKLRLVPAISLEGCDFGGDIKVLENIDHRDYILSVEILKNYPGSKLSAKRNDVKKFKEQYDYSVSELDLRNINVQVEIENLFHRWVANRNNGDGQNELIALKRYFKIVPLIKTLTTGIYINGVLEAFWSHEILDHSCTMSHFEKVDSKKFRELYSVLKQESAKQLSEKGIFFINFEQDLGISKLREGKMGYLPYGFLDKYDISFS